MCIKFWNYFSKFYIIRKQVIIIKIKYSDSTFLNILRCEQVSLIISNFTFQVAQAKTPDSSLSLLFLSHSTSNMLANSVSSTSKILKLKCTATSIAKTLAQTAKHHSCLHYCNNFLIFSLTLQLLLLVYSKHRSQIDLVNISQGVPVPPWQCKPSRTVHPSHWLQLQTLDKIQ